MNILPTSRKSLEFRRLAVNAQLAERFSTHQGVRLLSVEDAFTTGGQLSKGLTWDGVHLNPAGYQRWTDTLMPVLEGMLD